MIDEIPARCRVEAWNPRIAGISEVLHATMVDYVYPPHCHDTWTVLIVESGAIRYDLDSRECDASGQTIAVLPPGVIHDGQPASGTPAFRKRVLHLDNSFLPESLIGAAVDKTSIRDVDLRLELARIHDLLYVGVDAIDVQFRVALVAERIRDHLSGFHCQRPAEEVAVAHRLRLMLDEHVVEGLCLDRAAELMCRSTAHMSRSFSKAYGVSPHAYLVGRRIEAARSLLLAGVAPAAVAAEAGFYDQAHLTRHFKRHTSMTPARYASSHR
ncbi:MAG: AraC family transcriptional regulator [Acidimicrobiales bacterium]